MSIVDVSCFVGEWPFRMMPLSDVAALSARLGTHGISTALVSPLEAVLQPSPDFANRSWAENLAGNENLQFVPVANPARAGSERVWEFGAAAVRLMPGQHGYPLAQASEFVRVAAERGVTVIVQMRMIDQRMAHPEIVHPDVTVAEVVALAEACPDANLVVAGARLGEIEELLRRCPRQLWCDFSHAEGMDLVRRLITSYGVERLLCGTHAPIHVVEGLTARLTSADLTADEFRCLAWENAVTAGLISPR